MNDDTPRGRAGATGGSATDPVARVGPAGMPPATGTPAAGGASLNGAARHADESGVPSTGADPRMMAEGLAEGVDDPVAEEHETRSQRRRRERRAARKSGVSSWLKELPILLGIALVLAVVIKSFIVQAFFIPSGSMEQTLHGCAGCAGDRILVNKVPYYFSDPDPGDIVVFKGSESWAPEFQSADEPTNIFGEAWLWLRRAVGAAPPDEKDFVKRVIAVGGQTVACCDAQGRVTVDGKPLNEPYIYISQPDGYTPKEFGPVTVPEGRLFVMGDHRDGSADSTAHLDDQYQGTIAVDDVIGHAFIIVWPPSRFGWLSSPDIQTQAQALAVPAAVGATAPLGLGLLTAVPLVAAKRRGALRLRRWRSGLPAHRRRRER